ncbi:cytochrome c [Caulobacter sp. S45]|uniref:c-type cytochrome n=1 Tax=Caulobacter sp. S45 TaxID=1641861 RepID=UPI0020C64427|nr:cytochrome c [Caulobacter sp. S45]
MSKILARSAARLLVLGATSVAAASAQAAPPPDMSGAGLFAQNCSACHQLTGRGIPGAFPALAGDVFPQGPPEPVVKLLLNGRGGMPSFRADLDDRQIAAVLTYVRGAWGNHAPKIEPTLVAKVRGSQAQDRAAQALQAH